MRALGTSTLLLLLAGLLVSPLALAAVELDSYREVEVAGTLEEESTVPVDVPFHFTNDGLFYAKLLVTPWNAVNNGTANGTVDANHVAGVSGWWIEFRLFREDPANTSDEGEFLGAFADSTPTRLVSLPQGAAWLRATVHVPESAAEPGQLHRIPIALVYRADTGPSDGGSGASLDQSKGFTIRIIMGGEPKPLPALANGGGAPDDETETPTDGSEEPIPSTTTTDVPVGGDPADPQGPQGVIGNSNPLLVVAVIGIVSILVLLTGTFLIVGIMVGLSALKFLRAHSAPPGGGADGDMGTDAESDRFSEPA